MTFGWSDCQVTAEKAAERPVVTHHRELCKSELKALWHSFVLIPRFQKHFKQTVERKDGGQWENLKPRLTAALLMS